MRKILVTGSAGFIGYHLCKRLILDNESVIGFDNLNNYYDVNLKNERIKRLEQFAKSSLNKTWKFYKADLEDLDALNSILIKNKPEIIVHLAAQAGVRYSIKNPKTYISSNLVGFGNILEVCKNFNIKNFLYASSSSVYGGNIKIPFSERDPVNHPVSLYAATKRANELLAHSYSHLYDIKTTGMRFFTVYGPWGRPDMAPMIFAKSILAKKPIHIFNYGNMSRDFTYIDDIVDAIVKLISKPAYADSAFNKSEMNSNSSWAPFRLFNIGNNKTIPLMEFINILEEELGVKAIRKYEDMKQGDVESTYADISEIKKWIDYKPSTSIKVGIKKFIEWYKNYY